MHLTKLEIENHEWSRLRCGCGATAEHLVDRFLQAAAGGMWTLYAEIFDPSSIGAARQAFEMLTILDPDRDRLQRVYDEVGHRLGQISEW